MPDQSLPLLSMTGIRKQYPGVVALDGVDFELRRGEVHVLLGENGAGKSTLMKILSGSVKKDAGEITLSGTRLDIRNPHHALELGVGTIYQELHLIPHLTVAENIFLGREPARVRGLIDTKALLRGAREVISSLGIDIDCTALVRSLSVAQQQMVEIARALSLNARLLIMDEPTSALTEQEIGLLFATIRRLKETGVSIIYISHRLDEIFHIGDRVTVLLDGRSVGTFPIGSVTRQELIRTMVNREIKEHFPKVAATRGVELLRVQGLERRGVLRNITFSLFRGEVLGVAGLLGSGRTELARAIFGLDRIDAGTLVVDGKPYSRPRPRQSIRRGIGYLTEDRKNQGLILHLSVADNILIASLRRFSRLGIVNGKKGKAEVDRYVRELRIRTPGTNQQVIHLSGGNQQKVVLSKWLCSQAQLFIFDEPTRGIDVAAKVEIYKLMNNLAAEGAGVLMISSELPEVLGMSDRILVMRGGTIAAELDATTATQESVLQHALG